MKIQKYLAPAIGLIGILVMILDSQTALKGAKEGVELCIYTVIPSLFPFILCASLASNAILGSNTSFLRPVGRLCRIPSGYEILFALGLLGGYPVGAQMIHEAYADGKLSPETAHRLMGFCSNAGPAFIFGIVAQQFSSSYVGWVLWMIHIISAVIVGVILPLKTQESCVNDRCRIRKQRFTLDTSLKAIVRICGWVIIFRIVVTFLEVWILWSVSRIPRAIIIGSLELTNGCLVLRTIEQESLRFVISSAMLSFGGLCVVLQTCTVSEEMGTGFYFPGKILQCGISIILSCIFQMLLHNGRLMFRTIAIGTILCIAAWLILRKYTRKKVVAFCT